MYISSRLECQIMYIIVIGSQPIRLLVLPLCILLVLWRNVVIYMSIMYSIWKNKSTYTYLLTEPRDQDRGSNKFTKPKEALHRQGRHNTGPITRHRDPRMSDTDVDINITVTEQREHQ